MKSFLITCFFTFIYFLSIGQTDSINDLARRKYKDLPWFSDFHSYRDNSDSAIKIDSLPQNIKELVRPNEVQLLTKDTTIFWLVNNSNDTIIQPQFDATMGAVYSELLYNGLWSLYQEPYRPSMICGNSFWEMSLPPKTYIDFSLGGYRVKGSEKFSKRVSLNTSVGKISSKPWMISLPNDSETQVMILDEMKKQPYISWNHATVGIISMNSLAEGKFYIESDTSLHLTKYNLIIESDDEGTGFVSGIRGNQLTKEILRDIGRRKGEVYLTMVVERAEKEGHSWVNLNRYRYFTFTIAK